jgi:hypothetical protein
MNTVINPTEVICPLGILGRKDGQEYKDYSENRKEINKMVRDYCKGRLIHISLDMDAVSNRAERRHNPFVSGVAIGTTFNAGRNQLKREKRANKK